MKPIHDRFLSKIIFDEQSGCWNWVGAKNRQGYGFFKDTGKYNVQVHRYSYRHYLGEIPPKLQVLHTCDNPSCSNPAHLFLGTNADNALDRDRKGRNHYKLSPEQIIEIRKRHSLGESSGSLAKEFGINRQNMYKIVNNKSWKWVK